LPRTTPPQYGSALVDKVLHDCLEKGLNVTPGKFLLGNAGYALKFFLTTYHGVCYSLKELESGKDKPPKQGGVI
jgi:hypothetical protein